ncbi:Protein-tyrosine phosphatase [Ostertagia ostertagi]
MSTPNNSKEDGVLEETVNETVIEQTQSQPQEAPSSHCMDDSAKRSSPLGSPKSTPRTPPPALENHSFDDRLHQGDSIKFDLNKRRSATDPELSAKCASESVHVMRNRYRDILPYDRNRVVLSPFDDNSNGYINASLNVNGTGRSNRTKVYAWFCYEISLERELKREEWPDHGCPSGESQLINMIEKMAELHENTEAPVLVHCSAGVGRTGTIISVNYIRELIKSAELESLDLFDLVMNLRKQRASMVQTQDQYQFVHKCVAYYCRRHLGIPQPEPPKDDLDDSFSAPSPLAPTFNRSLQENGDQLIQIDDSDDEFSARAACSTRSRRIGQRGKLRKSLFESRKVSQLWKVIRDSRPFRNVSKLFGSP